MSFHSLDLIKLDRDNLPCAISYNGTPQTRPKPEAPAGQALPPATPGAPAKAGEPKGEPNAVSVISKTVREERTGADAPRPRSVGEADSVRENSKMPQASRRTPDMSFRQSEHRAGNADIFVGACFTRFICRAFAVAPAAHLAAITGQGLRAAERQLAGEVNPSAHVIAAFGPAFVADVFNAQWADQAARQQQREKLQAQLAALDQEEV